MICSEVMLLVSYVGTRGIRHSSLVVEIHLAQQNISNFELLHV